MRQGKIRWIDSKSGEGYIRDNETMKSHFIHFSAFRHDHETDLDMGTNWHYPSDKGQDFLATLKTGVEVEFDLIEDYNWTQVSRAKVVVSK